MRPGPGVRSGDGATIGRVARAATALIVATGVLAVPLAELAGADQTPTIAIESPERGATLGDTVTLSGTASDDSQITRVRVKVNRRVPFGKSLLWDGSQFVDGYHAFNASLTPTADGSVDWTVDIPMPVGRGIRFAAIAYDDDGNRSTDYRVFVTQGAVPPTFTVDQPLDGAAVPSTATFSGTAMDDGTVNHVHVLIRRGSEYWNGTTWTSDHPGRDSVGKATLTHVPEGILTGRNATWQSELPLPPGETVLAEIVVVDDADRVTKQTIEVHVEEAPEPAAAVTIDAPSSGDAVPARTTVSGTAAYDEIVDVEDFRSYPHVSVRSTGPGPAQWWNGTGWQDGQHRFRPNGISTGGPRAKWRAGVDLPPGRGVQILAQFVDSRGRGVGDFARIFVVVEGGDAPTVDLERPGPGTTVSPTTAIRGSAADDGRVVAMAVQVKRPGGPWWNGAGWQSSPFSFRPTVEPASDGDDPHAAIDWHLDLDLPPGEQLVVRAKARDDAGMVSGWQAAVVDVEPLATT